VDFGHNSDELLDALRWRVDGEVLTEGKAYDKARTPHFPVRVGKPVAVVRPKHADDVAAVIEAMEPPTAPATACCSISAP
jgi:FAD/FMN-containing dehydrogenase